MLIISKIFLRSNKQIFFAKTELAIRYCYGIKKYTTDQKLHYLTLSTDEAKDFKKNLKIFENLLIKYAPYGMKLQDFYDILDDKYDPKKEKILYTEEHVNSKSIHLPKLNFEYLKNNISEVENNVKNRKTFDGEINIQKNIVSFSVHI